MGHNDWDDPPGPELPAEAGVDTLLGYEPDNEWLMTAEPELRHEAMKTWFLTRYWDPANDTPYNSKDGYIFIHGGPYDADDELSSRFGDLCSEEAILAVKEDVESDGILDWAPIHHEQDYDSAFEYEANTRDEPYQFFIQRLEEVDALAAAEVDTQRRPTLRQLLFGYLIAALEAYLADTMSYWVAVDKSVFRRFVSTCKEFSERKILLSEILEKMDTLEDDVEEYIQNFVWHRLDRVTPLVSEALQIQLPPIAELMKHIIVRHDIIHRGGRTKNGDAVVVSDNSLAGLRTDVMTFVDGIESQLTERFPRR